MTRHDATRDLHATMKCGADAAPGDDALGDDALGERAGGPRPNDVRWQPSLFAGERPSDAMIVNELATMLRSNGVRELLRQAPPNRFTDVIGRAQRVLEGGGSHAVIINTLWRFIDEAELNEALQTDDKDEAPRELVRLMLEGPYKLATAH